MKDRKRFRTWKRRYKILFVAGIVIGIVIIAAGAFLLFWKPLGKNPTKEQQEEYAERTDAFYDGTFHTPEDFTLLTEVEGEPSEDSEEKYPGTELPVHKIEAFPDTAAGEWQITWFGHSTVMLQMEGKKIFIDPVLSEYSSPIQGIGGKRMAEPPMKAEDIPEVDVLVLSHDHYDHLDYNTILAIDDRVEEYCVPLGVENHLIRWGVSPDKIHTLAWWESTVAADITITSTPGQHYSGRLPWEKNSTLWCGYVFQAGRQQIYYTGDTGYGEFFKQIHEKFGKMDLVIMENGQYNKRWSDCHMMPEEGVQAAQELEAEWVLPVHWAGFVLATHKWSEPAERYTEEAEKAGVKVVTPEIGETVNEKRAAQFQKKWWRINF